MVGWVVAVLGVGGGSAGGGWWQCWGWVVAVLGVGGGSAGGAQYSAAPCAPPGTVRSKRIRLKSKLAVKSPDVIRDVIRDVIHAARGRSLGQEGSC